MVQCPGKSSTYQLLRGHRWRFGLFVHLGVYNVEADAPHIEPVLRLLSTVRERSITMYARNIRVPSDIESSKRTAAGAGLYAEMCAGCHLAPGMEKSVISQGLYPAAPELSQRIHLKSAEQFWVIKHGLKMAGMAAREKTLNILGDNRGWRH